MYFVHPHLIPHTLSIHGHNIVVFLLIHVGEYKSIECIRVDGASDEGPGHEEIQFMWAARHLSKGTIATLVTARNSGSSYLNRVELQNGCLAVAHANVFIPSTLGGSCMDGNTLNKEKYERNMNLATDVYINRVNECSCGDTVIHLYRGADSSEQQTTRAYLLQYLKGSKQQVEKLKKEKPNLYAYFEQVWKIRQSHSVPNLPGQYAFVLICCLNTQCSHPICKKGDLSELPKWYDGGPSISTFPLPIPDPQRCWGSSNCTDCSGPCTGHFLKPMDALSSSLSPMVPPSVILKEAFDALEKYPPEESLYLQLAQRTLLKVEEVKIWLEHLNTIKQNRKRGAAKAAETRKRKAREKQKATKQGSEYYCGACHEPYLEFTEAEEQWIGCESCDTWYHFVCLGITVAPEEFLCEKCR